MLRQLSTRMQPRLAAKPARLLRRQGGGVGVPASRWMATVAVEGIPKEPAELAQMTRLPNGIRVASEALPGTFAGVGVYVEAGSRFESPELQGVSHIMDRLVFKSTAFHSADAMLERSEALGGNFQCASSRESMMYQAATFNSAVPQAVSLLAETIRDAQITDDEVAAQIETARYEIAEIWSKPDLILPELLHSAAYKDNTLGNSLLCPEARLPLINRETIMAYRQLFYRPERMIVAFAGVEHNVAVDLARQCFGDMPSEELLLPSASSRRGSETSEYSASSSSSSCASSSTSPSSSSLASVPPQQQRSTLISRIPFIKNLSTSAPQNAAVVNGPLPLSLDGLDVHAPAHYTGGFMPLPASQTPPSPNEKPMTHISLAFEGVPLGSDDVYALATLQVLLGGGGSFSAGGPGKGMYSRLYTNVLNQYGWVDACTAFNYAYTDSSLFGISAACMPGHTSAMLDVMCQELRALTLERGHSRLQEAEVERAKKQLRSSLLMNLESRMVALEDLGRSIQVYGRKLPVRDMCRRIEALTVDELRRVAARVLTGGIENVGRGSGAPTVVLQEATSHGLMSRAMSWDQIQDRIERWQLGRRE